jgi:hypothetical protein
MEGLERAHTATPAAHSCRRTSSSNMGNPLKLSRLEDPKCSKSCTLLYTCLILSRSWEQAGRCNSSISLSMEIQCFKIHLAFEIWF